MNSKTKKIVFYSLLIGLMIYYVPWPKPIDVTLQGVKKSNEVTYNDVTFTIKGWQLNYLCRANKLKVAVTITPYDAEAANQATYTAMGKIFTPPDRKTIHSATMMRYSAAHNIYTGATVYFDSGFQEVLVKDMGEEDYYYVSQDAHGNKTNTVLDYFNED